MMEQESKIDRSSRNLMIFSGIAIAIIAAMLMAHYVWLDTPARQAKVTKMMVAVKDVDAKECSVASPMPMLLELVKNSQPVTNGIVNRARSWVIDCSEEIRQKSFVYGANSR